MFLLDPNPPNAPARRSSQIVKALVVFAAAHRSTAPSAWMSLGGVR
jgi:hypothetical protein